MQSDKGTVGRVWPRTFNGYAVDWVRAIEHYNRNRLARAGLQAKVKRPNERVVTGAGVLQIDDERIKFAQHLGRRLPVRPVEAVNRDAETRVREAIPLNHVVLRLAKVAVLWAKERCEVKKITAEALEDARRMDKGCGNRGRMQNGSDPGATQLGRPKLGQPIDRELDSAHWSLSQVRAEGHPADAPRRRATRRVECSRSGDLPEIAKSMRIEPVVRQ